MLHYFKNLTTVAYVAALGALALYALSLLVGGQSFSTVFHVTAYYLPAIAAVFVVSLQLDYLASIASGGEVSIRARMIDFLHWLMLVSINVSTAIAGQVTLGWLVVQLIVLVITGASVGIGLSRGRVILSAGEKASAVLAATAALLLGFAVWGLRSADLLSTQPESWAVFMILSALVLGVVWRFVTTGLKTGELGILRYLGMPTLVALGFIIGVIGQVWGFDYGWWMDALTSVVALTLVSGFIIHDLAVFRRDYTGYPRKLFLKGIFGCNALLLLAWLHALLSAQMGYVVWMLQNFGFTFVTPLGNTMYAFYYGAYEYHRYKQTR